MTRHPWARNRRRDTRGERWDALADAMRQADAPRKAAQEAAGEALPRGGANVSPAAGRAAREPR